MQRFLFLELSKNHQRFKKKARIKDFMIA